MIKIGLHLPNVWRNSLYKWCFSIYPLYKITENCGWYGSLVFMYCCSYGKPGVYFSGKHENCLSVVKMQFLPDQVCLPAGLLSSVAQWWGVFKGFIGYFNYVMFIIYSQA